MALIWLKDPSKTSAVVAALSTKANEAAAHIQEIISGDALNLLYNDPAQNDRTPDIVILPEQGVIYTTSKAKIAEHGGFSNDDTHIDLLIANPGLRKSTIYTPVQTTEIAPTILQLLNLDPDKLQAVRMEHTPILPGFDN